MPKTLWGNASRKITVTLRESFLEFLVLLVVVLSLCLDLLPCTMWAGSFGLVGGIVSLW